MYLLGLDIGTTNWKANLYDMKGRLIKTVSVPTPTKRDKLGHDFYSPLQLWSVFCDLIKTITKSVKNPEDIRSVCFASMAEAGLIVDRMGKPLSHIIPWYDKRSMPQAEQLAKKIPKEDIFGITGINLQYIFSSCKIMWLKQHEKAAFAKAAKWLCAPDYLGFKFTGNMATDYTQATRTALFDIINKKWSDRMLKAVGINENFLPDAYPSGTTIGEVTREASKECGLAIGTKVVLGGHDHLCGSFGVGVMKEGMLVDSMGTTESASVPIKDLSNLKKYYKTGFSFGRYVCGDLFYAMSGLYCSSGTIEWLIREFYKGDKRQKSEIYAEMIKEGTEAGPGSHGLLLYPHWLGIGAPYGLRDAKGVIVGLTPDTKRGDLVNAMYEGLASEYMMVVQTLEKSVHFKLQGIKVIGGGSKNRLWLQRKADIMGRELMVPHIPESVCFGAALLGGMGAGLIKDPMAIIKSFKEDLIMPDKKLHKFYAAQFKDNYMRFYKQILPFWGKK